MNTNLEFYGILDNLTSDEAQGFAKCFQAYADECAGTDILSIGYNPISGYVYIALFDGVQICSFLGCEVEFLVVDSESDENLFFSNYDDATNYEKKRM